MSTNVKNMKILAICSAFLMLLALFKLPIGFYTFLRIVITITSVVIIMGVYKNNVNFWIVCFGLIAIMFNPIIPIYLYDRSKWVPINITAALLFIVFSFNQQKPNPSNMFSSPFSFSGRITRTEYGLSFILYLVVYFVLIAYVESNNDNAVVGLLFIPMLWFLWAQGAKRCHDIDRSGWMQIIPFYVLWLIFESGTNGSNSFGDDPKAEKVSLPSKLQLAEEHRMTKSVIVATTVTENAPILKPVATFKIPENQLTILEVNNVNYSLIQDLLKKLRTLEITNNLSYEFLGTVATISIQHRNTSQVLLENLYTIMDNIEVLGVGNGSLKIKIK